MALKTIMLRHQIDKKKSNLEELRKKDADFQTREAELEAAILEADKEGGEDAQEAVTQAVDQFDADKRSHDAAVAALEEEIRSMEEEMAAASQNMDFEEAARLRDQVVKLRAQVEGSSEKDVLADLKKTARKGSAFAAGRKSAYGGGRRS